MKTDQHFDVIIVGGSYSGLSAAMSLGRASREVLVIDNGKPCNIQTPHSHNFLTHDGKTPKEISVAARQQVARYDTITFHQGNAISGKKTQEGFQIITAGGEEFNGRKLLFATGLKDVMPDIRGYADCWGISILHCPYCHGYEVRNVRTALTGNGDAIFEFAKLIAHWTNDLTLLTNGKSTLSTTQTEQLKKRQISVIENEIESIDHKNGKLASIVFKDRSSFTAEVMYARNPFTQHCDIPVHLGCELTEQGLLKVDNFQKTTVAGVFASGDNSSLARAVSVSVAAGSIAGASINRELVEEAFERIAN